MPEHTPAPTPARSIYGFVMYLLFKTIFVIYLCWALMPDKWLHAMGIYYYPQKYWAVAIPVQLLVALTLFAFFIYPGLNLAMTPPVDDLRTITDNFAIKRNKFKTVEDEETDCDCKIKSRCYKTKKNNIKNEMFESSYEEKIPPVEDLDIREVCKTLYLR